MRLVLAIVMFSVAPLYSLAQSAQQQPDPVVLQRIINSLQGQRNEAMDKAALAEARAAQLSEEVQRLKTEAAAKEAKPKE